MDTAARVANVASKGCLSSRLVESGLVGPFRPGRRLRVVCFSFSVLRSSGVYHTLSGAKVAYVRSQ